MKKVIGALSVSGVEGGVDMNAAANRCHTRSGLKGYRNSIVEPAKSGVRRAFITP